MDAPSLNAGPAGTREPLDEAASVAVLCVDDEPMVLEGLVRTLGFEFDVETAPGGAEGLRRLAERRFAVVVSDMRMPEMDGARFLACVRERHPETVRMLLTGHSEMDAAIAAVNDGQIFRFLTKPCARDQLIAAVKAAAEQHRLITAEQVLLEQTLQGSVRMLTEAFALMNPEAFEEARRVKTLSLEVLADLGVRESWPVEFAAMVAHIAHMTLPDDLQRKLREGAALDAKETRMLARVPEVAERLVAAIPRLEPVRDVLRTAGSASTPDTISGGAVLGAVRAYAAARPGGRAAFEAMRDAGRHHSEVLDALEKRVAASAPALLPRELPLNGLRAGMRLNEDVVAENGMVIVRKGAEVTAVMVERLRNFAQGIGVREPVHVLEQEAV